MANNLNPSAERLGNKLDKLLITYDTEANDNVKTKDVTMKVTRENKNQVKGIRIEFKAKGFTHTSGFLPDSVVGNLQEPPKSISYDSGAIKVVYMSDKSIGDITGYF